MSKPRLFPLLSRILIYNNHYPRALEVYTSQLPSSSVSMLHTTYETVYSFTLRHEGLFHKVSLHGELVASSVRNQAPEDGGPSSAVLVANWKTGKQTTIFPRFAEVRHVLLGVTRLTLSVCRT